MKKRQVNTDKILVLKKVESIGYFIRHINIQNSLPQDVVATAEVAALFKEGLYKCTEKWILGKASLVEFPFSGVGKAVTTRCCAEFSIALD